MEYWSPSSFRSPEDGPLTFTSKLETDLYAHAKAKTVVCSLDVSRDGSQFATFAADRWPPTARYQCRPSAALFIPLN